jgi:hypothetical protein
VERGWIKTERKEKERSVAGQRRMTIKQKSIAINKYK